MEVYLASSESESEKKKKKKKEGCKDGFWKELQLPKVKPGWRHVDSKNMRTERLPAISVNKVCCSHHITATQMVSPEGTQDGDKCAAHCQAHLAVIHCRHPQWCTLRKLRMRKRRMLGPGSRGAYQRNDFSEPTLLHLPIHIKALLP